MSQKKSTVLIVEDEKPIRKVLSVALESADYRVIECDNGREGIRLVTSTRPELMLLDLGLPDIDGREVISTVREWTQMPIIVCSVRDGDKDMIEALNIGADDYVTKPFNSSVLLARVHAALRKAVKQEAGEPELSNGCIRMDLVRHEVYVGGRLTAFTPKEYELLRYFLLNRGKMLTHKQILKDVWGSAHTENLQYLRVYVSQIREKIENTPDSAAYIITEPSVGYRMESMD